MPEASPALLDSMNSIEDLDVGEAELFAVAAERKLRVITADKRAVRAVANVPEIQTRLDGLVVTLEALMLGLTTSLGDAQLRACGKQMAAYDQMARAVFSSSSTPLKEALGSYLASYEGDSKPMQLWKPS
ncbi:MAG TPA: hypothetical protein VE907_18310 [Gammaproteobacteria bacterium]|nr:hypothetical protein [Gammaproteobacteria bacterium]